MMIGDPDTFTQNSFIGNPFARGKTTNSHGEFNRGTREKPRYILIFNASNCSVILFLIKNPYYHVTARPKKIRQANLEGRC